jgi:glycosyltransferase involved in cell wall biosynthesis
MLIYAPLEHLDSRYTTHLDRDIIDYLDENMLIYHYLDPKVINEGIINGSFLDSDNTVYRQFTQFNEFISLLLKRKKFDMGKDYTLFTTDLWNFSLLAVPYLNYFSGYNIKIKGVLHAGSFTDTDFVRDMERMYKGFEEILFDITDTIYVASDFIKNDVIKKRIVDPNKIVVSGLPIDEKGLNLPKVEKENIVIFNGRNVDEKQPYLFEIMKEKLPYKFINTQQQNYTKEEYYNLLNKSKVVVSFALQENFGYGIQEAVKLGCVPVLPNRLVYPEIYPQQNLYNTFEESIQKVKDAIEGNLSCPLPKIKTNKEIFKIWFND